MVPGDVRYQSTVPTTTTTAPQNPGTTGGFYNRRPEGNMAGPGQRGGFYIESLYVCMVLL